jgi:ribosome-binding protein aMBF1 (putative translation factor)
MSTTTIVPKYRSQSVTVALAAKRVSAAWLGRKMGISREMARHLASGRYLASEEQAQQIAEILDVDLALLFLPVVPHDAVSQGDVHNEVSA